MTICEDCILYGRCDGRCGDTDPLYYWEEEQNDERDYANSIRNEGDDYEVESL